MSEPHRKLLTGCQTADGYLVVQTLTPRSAMKNCPWQSVLGVVSEYCLCQLNDCTICLLELYITRHYLAAATVQDCHLIVRNRMCGPDRRRLRIISTYDPVSYTSPPRQIKSRHVAGASPPTLLLRAALFSKASVPLYVYIHTDTHAHRVCVYALGYREGQANDSMNSLYVSGRN